MKGSSSGAGDADLQSICSPDGWEINSQGLITPEMGREKKKSLTLFSQHISKHCEESRDFRAHPLMPEPTPLSGASCCGPSGGGQADGEDDEVSLPSASQTFISVRLQLFEGWAAQHDVPRISEGSGEEEDAQ